MNAAALYPTSEAEVSDLIRAAKSPLQIIGGGTRPIGKIGEGLTQLCTAKMAGITLYDPSALTLIAGAGTPLEDITKTLGAENQRLAFEPMDHRPCLNTAGTPSIGAVLAGNISGPRRIQAGACRDHALGIRYVDGLGRIAKNGGRVMKNVTGYDLVKLMAGAWGTLGVLTEIAFKTMPLPEMAAQITVQTPMADRAVQAMAAALTSPFDVTGAAWHGGRAYIRIEGFEKSVLYRLQKLQNILGEFGDCTLDQNPESLSKTWADIRDVAPLQNSAGDLWRISVKPTDGPHVLQRLDAQGYMDWGGGLIWAVQPNGTDVRAKLAGIKGHATLIRSNQNSSAFPPLPPALQTLNTALRTKYDPRGILNPARMA